MEQADKLTTIRLITITFLSFTLWGCSQGEPARTAEQNRTPAVASNNTSVNVAINSQTHVVAANSQTPVAVQSNRKPVIIKGGETCEDYLLKKVAKEKDEGNRMVKLNVFNTEDISLPSALKKWLETKDEERLVAVELRFKEKKALMLGSRNLGATSIASNFQNWYVRLDGHAVEFLSLSKDPKLIFWDRNGLLNYYVITYGDEFLEDRDWDNLTLDLLRYSISPDGESQLVSEERNVRCE